MYLADVYGTDDSWYPKDTKRRALVNQKLFFDACILFPRLRNVTVCGICSWFLIEYLAYLESREMQKEKWNIIRASFLCLEYIYTICYPDQAIKRYFQIKICESVPTKYNYYTINRKIIRNTSSPLN